MQIVIDISEEMYEELKYLNVHGFTTAVEEAVANGTPLPKGHGGLIDVNEIIGKVHGVKSITAVLEATVIIPAEREGEEG